MEDDNREIVGLEAYNRFRRLAGLNDYRGAYLLLRGRPELICHMSFAEIPSHYSSFLFQVGQEAAGEFKKLTQTELKSIEGILNGGELFWISLPSFDGEYWNEQFFPNPKRKCF